MRKKIGRPSKFSPAVVRTLCQAVADGVPICHAAVLCGVSLEWVCRHRRSNSEFDRQIRESISGAIQSRLAVVRAAMESNDLNIALRSATWWLTHTPGAAEHFSESRRVELTGADGLSLDGRAMILIWPHQQLQNQTRNENKEIPDAPDRRLAEAPRGAD